MTLDIFSARCILHNIYSSDRNASGLKGTIVCLTKIEAVLSPF